MPGYMEDQARRKGGKGMLLIAVTVLVAALVIGGVLIGSFIYNLTYYTSEEGTAHRLALDQQIGALEDEKTQEWFDNGKSARYYELEYEIRDLEWEKWKLIPLPIGLFIGIGVLLIGGGVSIPLFVIAHQRTLWLRREMSE